MAAVDDEEPVNTPTKPKRPTSDSPDDVAKKVKTPHSSSNIPFVVISDITQAELLSVPLANLQAKLTVRADSSMYVQNTMSNGEVTIKQGMQLVGFGKIGFWQVQDWVDVDEYEVEFLLRSSADRVISATDDTVCTLLKLFEQEKAKGVVPKIKVHDIVEDQLSSLFSSLLIHNRNLIYLPLNISLPSL